MERRIPIHEILNDTGRRPETPESVPSGSELSSPASDLCDAFTPSRPARPRTKKGRDASDLQWLRPDGPIKYRAYENYNDHASMQLMEPYNIQNFGHIESFAAHIPYSSDKKDLKLKTGREKLEVFMYTFADPKDNHIYEVMWDYKSGLVRISPFFKICNFKKTGPAKMLDANPGMRDVTVQITGGNRTAQGYWLQMRCAKAVCATFCYKIRGALIPIFGPDFPLACVEPDQKGFNVMAIDPAIIKEASHEAKAYRHASRPLQIITSHPQQLVEDQYAGSSMELRSLQHSKHFQQASGDASYGRLPPTPHHYELVPVSLQRNGYGDARGFPDYGHYGETPHAYHPRDLAPIHIRPESSDSENDGVFTSLDAVPPHPSLVPSPKASAPDEASHLMNKRRMSRDDQFEKRRRMADIVRCFNRMNGSPDDTHTLSPASAPIDPVLEQGSRPGVGNEPTASVYSDHSTLVRPKLQPPRASNSGYTEELQGKTDELEKRLIAANATNLYQADVIEKLGREISDLRQAAASSGRTSKRNGTDFGAAAILMDMRVPENTDQ